MELLQEFVFIPLDIYRETRHNKGIPIWASVIHACGGRTLSDKVSKTI